jgi:hypothetical protein
LRLRRRGFLASNAGFVEHLHLTGLGVVEVFALSYRGRRKRIQQHIFFSLVLEFWIFNAHSFGQILNLNGHLLGFIRFQSAIHQADSESDG